MNRFKDLIVESFYDYDLRLYKTKRNKMLLLWSVFIISLVVFFLR